MSGHRSHCSATSPRIWTQKPLLGHNGPLTLGSDGRGWPQQYDDTESNLTSTQLVIMTSELEATMGKETKLPDLDLNQGHFHFWTYSALRKNQVKRMPIFFSFLLSHDSASILLFFEFSSQALALQNVTAWVCHSITVLVTHDSVCSFHVSTCFSTSAPSWPLPPTTPPIPTDSPSPIHDRSRCYITLRNILFSHATVAFKTYY